MLLFWRKKWTTSGKEVMTNMSCSGSDFNIKFKKRKICKIQENTGWKINKRRVNLLNAIKHSILYKLIDKANWVYVKLQMLDKYNDHAHTIYMYWGLTKCILQWEICYHIANTGTNFPPGNWIQMDPWQMLSQLHSPVTVRAK